MLFKDALIEDVKHEYFHEYSLPDEYLERIILIDSANDKLSEDEKLVEVAIARNDAIKVYSVSNTINFVRSINQLPSKSLMSCHLIYKEDSNGILASTEIPVGSAPNMRSIASSILGKISCVDVRDIIVLYSVVSGNGTHPLHHEFDIFDMNKTVDKIVDVKKSYNGLINDIYYSIVDKMDGYYTGSLNVYALNRACTNIVLRAAPDINDTITANVHTEVCKLEDAKLINYNEEFFYAESIFYDNKDITKNSKLDKDKLEKLKKGNFHKLGPVLYQLSVSDHVLNIKVSVIIEI